MADMLHVEGGISGDLHLMEYIRSQGKSQLGSVFRDTFVRLIRRLA